MSVYTIGGVPVSTLQARRLFIAESAQHLSGGRIGADFVCWRALVQGTCPFTHDWGKVEGADIPVATYGGADHLRLSDDAWVKFIEENHHDEPSYA